MNKIEVITAILSGELDADRDAIVDAIKTRDRQLRENKREVLKASLIIGQKVRVEGIRPKQLEGIEGTVKAIRGLRVDIDVDAFNATKAGPRFAYGNVIRGLPVSSLEVV